ncbi:hypothetical protein KUTeg_001678 [Tegillarca granosa]|uniref:Copper type II ascorbate-dependent monooxygenase C-terminal domain-containing protein n=1 Tax=Tegillarca granosa TaxID=220873 RepID=A0ABQ9FS52_TEGGR|nr:hypothetical protein KUTeg_001675 [Tegillarca granosa]KAJ8320091.1 hypothetical protein KUTeg_001678 [Tegillarca granosa]
MVGTVGRHRYPLPLLPGDVIKLTCNYDTRPANTTLTWGTSANQESCTSIIGYYPSRSWSHPTCFTYKDVPMCEIKANGVYEDCNFNDFLKSVDTDITISAILETCFRKDICSPTCTSLVWNMRRHPCLNGNLFDLWASNLVAINNSRLMKLFSAIIKCYKTRASNFIKRKRVRFSEINKN